MKKLYIASIATFSLLLIVETAYPADSASTVFGLLYVKDNNCADQIVTELYPICKFSNGKFEEVSIQTDSGHCCPDFILRKVKDFTVFESGSVIGRFEVSEVGIGGYDCSDILVGRGTTDIPNTTLRAKSEDKFEEVNELRAGELLSYKQKRLSSQNLVPKAVGAQNLARPLDKILTKKQVNNLIELAKKKYEETNDGVRFLDSIRVEISKSYDLDGDAKIEQLFVTSAKIEHIIKGKCESGDTSWREESELRLTLWVQLDDSQYKLISHSIDKKVSDSWDESYEFIDLLDIDGNNIPELIMESYGYEYYSFQVYRFSRGKFELVFDGAGYGC